MGFWLALLEELVKLGRRYPVVALLVISAIVGAVSRMGGRSARAVAGAKLGYPGA